MNRLAHILVLAAVVACGLAIDWKQPCDLEAKCMQDAVAKRKECDALTDSRNARWPPKYTDAQNKCAEHGAYLNTLDYARRNHKITCLQNSLANATIVSCNATRIGECEAIAASYVPATRAKREARPDDTHAHTDAPADHEDPDEADEEDEKEDRRRKRQANSTTTTPSAAKGTTTTSAAAAKAAAAAADNKAKTELNNQINKCWADANAIDAVCGRLAGCCSENWLCDLEYQKSDISKEYGQKQREYQLERRVVYPPSCPAPPPPATTKGAAPTTPAPSTAAAGRR